MCRIDCICLQRILVHKCCVEHDIRIRARKSIRMYMNLNKSRYFSRKSFKTFLDASLDILKLLLIKLL